MRIVRYLSCLVLILTAGFVFAEAGRLHGTVKDPSGKPIDKVTLTIELQGETHHKYTAQTNSKGEFMHIGIAPGQYRVTPTKEGYTPVQYAYADIKVTVSEEPAQVTFVMQPASQKAEQSSGPPQEAAQITEAKKGVALLNEGKVDEGIAALEKALTIDPNLASVHYNLGLAYEKKDQPEEARKHFQEAIKIKPDLGEAYLALGNSYMSAKQFAPAAEAFSKAGESMPDNYDVFYNLGASYSNSGKYAEAEQAFRKAATINPKEPVVHYQLAMALVGQSKNADAKAEFQKYLELNPNAADKQEVLEMIQSLQ